MVLSAGRVAVSFPRFKVGQELVQLVPEGLNVAELAIYGRKAHVSHIVDLRYGLTDEKEHTQKEVADMMGISQSYISRLEKKIIGKLREEMAKMA